MNEVSDVVSDDTLIITMMREKIIKLQTEDDASLIVLQISAEELDEFLDYFLCKVSRLMLRFRCLMSSPVILVYSLIRNCTEFQSDAYKDLSGMCMAKENFTRFRMRLS